MKHTCFLILFIAAVSNACSQQVDTRKFIDVTGSAQMMVQPDEIELEIQLQEYEKGGKKIALNDVNKDFQRVLVNNRVDTAGLSFISSSDFYWWYWWQNRQKYYQTRAVTIKLPKGINLLKLVENLNEKWVVSIRIAKSSHSKITEYRRQVKEEAARMAKEKALYLLQAMGEELGTVLSVEEIPEATNNYWWNAGNLRDNSNFNGRVEGQDDTDSIGGAADIKLRYEIKVKFAIK
jgi:uncharacterized protein YggE